MKHIGTAILETQRLILRRFSVYDAEDMYKNWASDPEVTKHLTWPTYKSADDAVDTLNEWVSHYSENDFYHWAITVKENGDEPIGSIGVVKNDDRTEMAHMGYCIAKNWWGQGITAEALAAIINYLFEKVGINRIESCHDPENPNSGRVMVKCGMAYEGTMRQGGWSNYKGICDYAVYSILKSEYKK